MSESIPDAAPAADDYRVPDQLVLDNTLVFVTFYNTPAPYGETVVEGVANSDGERVVIDLEPNDSPFRGVPKVYEVDTGNGLAAYPVLVIYQIAQGEHAADTDHPFWTYRLVVNGSNPFTPLGKDEADIQRWEGYWDAVADKIKKDDE